MKLNTPLNLAMLISGGVLLLGSVVVGKILPVQSTESALAANQKSINEATLNAKKAKEASDRRLSDTEKRLWTGPDDQIAPTALDLVTKLATKHRVKLSAFRPQKAVVAGELDLLPFFVSVDGPFPMVSDFEKELETDAKYLVVTMFQISSADSSTNTVTASLTLSAYTDPARANSTVNLAGITNSDSTKSPGGAVKPAHKPEAADTPKGGNHAPNKA